MMGPCTTWIHRFQGPGREPRIHRLIPVCCPRREFQREDIALNYQDAEGDLVRLLSDEDVGLMVKQARGLPSQKRLFPWKLHVTQKDNYSVYNTVP